MINLAVLFFVSFLLAYLSVPLVRRVCLRLGFLDMPAPRKIHTKAMPRLGGIAIIAGFLPALLLALYIYRSFSIVFYPKLTGFLVAVFLLVLLGLWDDIRGVKAPVKLIFQCLIAIVLFYADFRIRVFTDPFGHGHMQLSFAASLFFTVFWILGIINAINLIDGLDGLASGVVFISCLFLLFAGFYLNTPATVVLLIILCGSTLAFILYNFPPASIFLGDTGSMFLGMMIAVSALSGMQYKVVTSVALIMPICVLAIPIYDTLLAMWRRFLKKGSIFVADRKHLHHRFLQLGLTQKQVVVIFYLATAYFGIISFLFLLIPDKYALLLLLLLGAGLFAAIRTVGFIERAIKRTHTLERRLNKGA